MKREYKAPEFECTKLETEEDILNGSTFEVGAGSVDGGEDWEKWT